MKRERLVSMMAVGLLATAWATMAKADGGSTNAAAAPAGEPKIVLDKMVYDFGTTSLVQQLSGVFVISNGGTAVLDLKKPTTSCGCTIAALKTDKLAPGEKTDLSFTMNVANVSHGHAEKRITVPSNDTKNPAVILTVKADMVSVYSYNPMAYNFEGIHIGSSTNVTIDVKRTDGKPLGITRVEASGNLQNVHPTLELSESSPSTALAHVVIDGSGGAHRFGGTIAFYSGDSKMALFAVPLGGRVVGDISQDRETLFWGIVDPNNWPGPAGQSVTVQKVKITSSVPDEKLELTNATSTVPEVKVSIVPLEAGKSYEIVASVPKAPKEIARGTIKVETNYKSQPTIDIPVTVNVLRRD